MTMEINNSNDRKSEKSMFEKYFNKRFVLFIFFIALIVGAYKGSSLVQAKGYSGLWDFISSVSSNYWKGMDAKPESMSIEIKDEDFKKLEKNRNQALERGVIVNDLDGDYVPATIDYSGTKIKVKLRLKGHMTDHLQDNKWSFRIKTKGKDSFMGMKRFTIQHPGTRGYIYEWIYHELMKREGVIALRYKFINVTVNGNDWGIYAVEENFENELIENNNRKKGPIIRFNPDLYWVNRYNEYTYHNSFDEFASYYSANPEAYRESNVLADSVQKQYYLNALALVEGLRNKKISVAQAFDLTRLAKFHAIIDLVGGVHSIDWSDIKYYYNPLTSKLEPVAYESFTNLNSRDISGQYKFVMLDSTVNFIDWHSMIFSDKLFFAEYVKQLERMASSKYLDEFFAESNTDLQKNLAIIYKEFPYKKFDKSDYFKRQQNILRILSPPKALHAYLRSVDSNVVTLQVAPIDALPVQINALLVNGFRVVAKPLVLPAKQAREFLNYSDIKCIMPDNFKWNNKLIDSLMIEYSILGSSEKKEAKVFPFPHTDNEFIAVELKKTESNISEFSFLTVNEDEKLIHIKPGIHSLDKDLVIPFGYRLIGSAATIDMIKNAKIISYSSFFIVAEEDEQFVFKSSDSSSSGIIFINAEKSLFKNVTFLNLPKVLDKHFFRTGALTFYESAVEFDNCSFYKCKAEDAINLIRSPFSFKKCLFKDMHNDALDIDFSEGTVTNCVFENSKENALDITMGKVTIQSIYIEGSGNKGINAKAGTQLNGNDIRIKNSTIAVSGEDNADIVIQKLNISDSKTGIVAYNNKSGAGYPVIQINSGSFANVNQKYLKDKKASLIFDGVEATDDTKNVEAIIKGEKKK